MIELDNRTSMPIEEDFLNRLSDSLTDKNIELIITTDNEIQKINMKFRDINKATDVLSFPYDEMPMSPLGSIVISSDFAKIKAEEFGHTFNEEVALLFIHGLLHIMGYDHEIDSGEMRKEEKRIIKDFKLPNSLIIRTRG